MHGPRRRPDSAAGRHAARTRGRALSPAGSALRAVSLEIPVRRFDLDLTVRSHGWYDLPPFSWDAEAGRLQFVFLEGERPVAVEVSERKGEPGESGAEGEDGIRFSYAAAAGAAADRVQKVVSRVLDLGIDLSSFHALCRAKEAEGFGWIARRGAGRVLRAATPFEDAVKVLLTTNCSWGLTRAMVGNLVLAFGRGGAFPDARFLAGFSEKRLREEIRCGYRARYLLEFADRVASQRLDLGRWEEPVRPDEEVGREIAAQPGFGPYAVQTLSRLLGRHAKLGLDSWSRKKVAELRFRSRRVSDGRVERFYRPFGQWAGLAFWLDVTKDWHDRTERLWP